MHRTDAEGNVNSKFDPGNPATGQKATRIDAAFLNAVQEEIATVIESANLQLDKSKSDQLYEAIIALIAGSAGGGDAGEGVEATRQILAAGLATGGGNLAADRTITVAKATAAEVSAAAIDDKAVTPLGLAGLVGMTVVGNAWIIRIGSTIMQLFPAVSQGNSNTVVTLPQAFPSLCKAAFVNGGSPDTGAQDNFPYVSGKGRTSVSLFNARETVQCDVMAIGQ